MMIPFGNSQMTSEKGYEDLKSRIIWQVEKRDSLLFPKANSLESDTSKPLVGKIDDEFIVTRVRPFYINFFPQIFAKVQIDNALTQRRIYIRYRMGLWTSLAFILIILLTILILHTLINSNDINSVLDNIILLLLFPGFATILAAFETNKLKEKITEILEK